MEVYTLKEAARTAKMGIETLKRACEEGLVKASQLPNRQWIIAESALEEALHKGVDFRNLTKRAGKKRAQPEALKRWLAATKTKKKAA